MEPEKDNTEQFRKAPQLVPFHWKKGVSGNPKGRPKGKTLKEFAREYLFAMSEEDKIAFLASLPPEIIWRQAEGNPHSTEEKRIAVIVPVPILGGASQAHTIMPALTQEALRGAIEDEL